MKALTAWWAPQPRPADAPHARRWFGLHGLDVDAVSKADAARFMMTDHGAPAALAELRAALWLPCVAVPLHDAHGAVVGVAALPTKPNPRAPWAASRGIPDGACMTSPTAALALRGADPSELRIGGWDRFVLTVEEGPAAFLRAVSGEGPARALLGAFDVPADVGTLGVLPGAWCPSIAARVPSGCRVFVRTGEALAERIAADLRGRCVVRVRP